MVMDCFLSSVHMFCLPLTYLFQFLLLCVCMHVHLRACLCACLFVVLLDMSLLCVFTKSFLGYQIVLLWTYFDICDWITLFCYMFTFECIGLFHRVLTIYCYKQHLSTWHLCNLYCGHRWCWCSLWKALTSHYINCSHRLGGIVHKLVRVDSQVFTNEIAEKNWRNMIGLYM